MDEATFLALLEQVAALEARVAAIEEKQEQEDAAGSPEEAVASDVAKILKKYLND